MPRPQFILCAQSVSIDQDVNTLSVFHVMEGINIFVPDGGGQNPQPLELDPKHILSTLNFRVIAVWMRIDGEDNEKDEYEYEFHLHPPGEEEKLINSGTFRFTALFHRLQLLVFRDKPWSATGMLKVISKISKRAEHPKKWQQRWYQQEYWFPVAVNPVPKGDIAGQD